MTPISNTSSALSRRTGFDNKVFPISPQAPSLTRGGVFIKWIVVRIEPEAIHGEKGCLRYWSDLKSVSQGNRRRPTEAEEIMWKKYLSRDKTGFRFLRQKPIHRFVVDFYCAELRLAIEIDGSSHQVRQEIDVRRDKLLGMIGIQTVRFSNDEVINHPELITSKLLPLLSKRGASEASGEIGGRWK